MPDGSSRVAGLMVATEINVTPLYGLEVYVNGEKRPERTFLAGLNPWGAGPVTMACTRGSWYVYPVSPTSPLTLSGRKSPPPSGGTPLT